MSIENGRVSTRQHIGYASAQMTIGFARYLRKLGCSPAALAFYKAVVTLDAAELRRMTNPVAERLANEILGPGTFKQIQDVN